MATFRIGDRITGRVYDSPPGKEVTGEVVSVDTNDAVATYAVRHMVRGQMQENWVATETATLVEPRSEPRSEPRATAPAHVALVEVTRSSRHTPAADRAEVIPDVSVTLVTAAGHRLDLAPWVIDALRSELTR